MGKATTRLAIAATASIAALSMSAASASAAHDPFDAGVLDTNSPFRLVTSRLEPGCYLATQIGSPVVGHVAVTNLTSEAHVTVLAGANFSVDQVLVPGANRGYSVYNTFDTGTNPADADIDPDQTATDLTAPGGSNVMIGEIIVCISDHGVASNEPYVSDGLPGEVAAINRPIIQPTIAAMGASALTSQNTYKVGFGYEVQRGYDSLWRQRFNFIGGDPMGVDTNGDLLHDHTWIYARPEQRGVRRFNDIDEFGEAFNSGIEKSSYGQTIYFDVSGTGDPQAYLHKSLPGTVNGGNPPIDSTTEAAADQTDSSGLFTFSAQGDLPLSWAVKASLAPEAYGKKVTLTDDMLRAWEQSWQDYYVGKGAKPTLPLAPGTNSPAPKPGINIVNPQVKVDVTGKETVVVAGPSTTTIVREITPAAKLKTKVISARLMRTKSGRHVQVFVQSADKRARIQLRMYDAKGRRLAMTSRMVATNRFARVANLRVGAKVKKVKASVVG